MARTRVTTSVSTLVNDIVYLNDIAKVSGRKDFTNGLKDLTSKVNKLVNDYNAIRSEVDDFKATMFKAVEVKEEVPATA